MGASWLPDPIEWVDGSGVSRYNMVTPRTLVAVLQQIEKQLSWEQIQTLFPKSGPRAPLKPTEAGKRLCQNRHLTAQSQSFGLLDQSQRQTLCVCNFGQSFYRTHF
jgi:hypothetical protein